MVDARVQASLEAIQFHNPDVDLAKVNIGTYGQYLNSIHVVIENAEGLNEIRESQLKGMRDMIVALRERNLGSFHELDYLPTTFIFC